MVQNRAQIVFRDEPPDAIEVFRCLRSKLKRAFILAD
jgi:hypothetical protein